MKRRLLSIFSLLLLVLVLGGAVTQRQRIKDEYIVRTTDLQPASADILTKLALTKPAAFIYEASQPMIEPAAIFNRSCSKVTREQSIILGCYTQQKIFIYDITDVRLSGVKEVTAAHELLHAEYERMSLSEKKKLDSELLATVYTINDQRFKDTLAEYRRTEPDQIANELHSILGTEIEILPTKLEEHYKKYFTNRSLIVRYTKQYEQIFTELDATIKNYDSQLAELRNEKELLEDSLQSQQQSIESDKNSLELLRSSDPGAYNDQVPTYNAKIRSYNFTINRLKQIIEQYNVLVQKRNNLAITQNDLVKQLDSSYQPLN